MVRILSVIIMLFLLCGCQAEHDFKEEYVTFPESNPLTEDVETTSALQEEADGELEGIKICIDPGHGLFTEGYNEAIGPGASATKPAFVSGTSGAYQTEEQFNLKLAYLLKPMLEDLGAVVYLTRTTEKAELSNIGRAEFANDLGCDVVVRIHADGSSDTMASGISVLVPGANTYLNDEELIESSESIGRSVLDKLIFHTSSDNRGLIKRTDLTGFNWTKVPCILVECGFMSNPDDDMKLADESYRKLLALGITEGLIEYYMTVQ